ncbi:MAG: 4Fe-4S binding protein [Nitrospirota bacterium]
MERTKTPIEAVQKEKEIPIEIFTSWCKGCGICVAVCPKGVLALARDEKCYAKYPEKCIRCGNCDVHCPDFAITGMKRRILKTVKSVK